jgi:hypothetical protein
MVFLSKCTALWKQNKLGNENSLIRQIELWLPIKTNVPGTLKGPGAFF